MRVKRLEIQGFKSFKDKTVIHFDHRITGIVGPNGCGKSNIVDAFFWVMGEQSYKHMRGTSSEDLIFNGSSKYAALGVAEATLVMEEDLDEEPPAGASFKESGVRKTKETSVTRRLYRSGEGEYLINGLPSRLRDIHELFMDSGLGTKGYSVIEQGQIAKVVNAKPDERRMLFEEAAGIAKYKARKKESLRKLEATEHNMSRLQDLIREVEGHRTSLERQSEKARTYERYRESLTQKEMVWAKRKKDQFDARTEVLQGERLACQSMYESKQARIQALENDYEVRKTEKLDKQKQQEELNSTLHRLTEQLSQKRSALELSQARQSDLVDQKKRLTEEQSHLRAQMQELETRVETKTESLQEVQASLEAVAERLSLLLEKESQRIQQLSSLRSEMAAKDQELVALGREVAKCAEEKALFAGKLEAIQAEFQGFESQYEALREKDALLNERLEAEEAKEAECAENLEKARAACMEALEQRKMAEAALQRARQELFLKEQSLGLLDSKLKALEELDLQHEGLGKGVKTVLEWFSKHQGDGRVLMESIEVQEGAEKAIEAVLQERLEAVVGAKRETVLAWLEEHPDPERVHFFLGTEANANKIKKPDIPGLIGPLRSACKVQDAAVGACLDVCLEGVYWIEDAPLEVLLKARKPSDLSLWVTKKGMVFTPDGFLQVGTKSESVASQVLRRAQNKTALREDIKLGQEEKFLIEENLSLSEQGFEAARDKWESLEAETKQLEFDLLGLQREKRSLEFEARSLSEQIKLAAKQQDERHGQIDQLTSQLQGREKRQLEQGAARLILEDACEVYRQRREALEVEADAEREVTQDCRIQCASLEERVQSLKREVELALKAQAESEKQLRRVEEACAQFSKDHEGFGAQEEVLIEAIESLTVQAAEKRDMVASIRDALESLEAGEESVHKELKELQSQSNEQGEKGHQIVLDLERIYGEWSHISANMQEKYGQDWLARCPSETQAEGVEEDELSLTEAVSKLKEKMKRLGEVNLGAIQEFEVMKERHETLLREKGDLEVSVKNLQEAIEHINKTSKERFQKAFEAISSRFERLYPIIFGGGSAKLTLLYPEGSRDILEAGIEIYASPPGKKVSHIGLLSGGEKALTAVCLVFAIFMVKPSPFCVLDEVDAPLDDANVGRFNGLLKEMSSKSQFILITHNKKTMELNDTLYGVTMEEPGVSKMVSIEMQA